MERVDLDQFLERLDDRTAAETRVAAARIDVLAREGHAVQGIESRFLPLLAGSGLLFVIGIVLFLMPGTAPRVVTLACLAALPAVAATYGFHVIGRTRADVEAEDLNRTHFLPHGGLYFAAGERPAAVVLVEPQSAGPREGVVINRKSYW